MVEFWKKLSGPETEKNVSVSGPRNGHNMSVTGPRNLGPMKLGQFLGARKWQNMSVSKKSLAPETDNMCHFPRPETDIMGKDTLGILWLCKL